MILPAGTASTRSRSPSRALTEACGAQVAEFRAPLYVRLLILRVAGQAGRLGSREEAQQVTGNNLGASVWVIESGTVERVKAPAAEGGRGGMTRNAQ
jgi:hypothetical protein